MHRPEGKLTVTGATAGDTVIGAGTTHGWCKKANTAATAAEGNNVTYVVAPTVSGDCNFSTTNKLANGTYEVRVHNPDNTDPLDNSKKYPYLKPAGEWEFQSGTGCYATTPRRGIVQSTFTVSGGSGSLTNDPLDLGGKPNFNGTNDASLVCVAPSGGNTSGAPGIFSPLRVVAI